MSVISRWNAVPSALSVLLLLAACAPTRLYPGEQRDPSSVAHLSTRSGRASVKMFAVDGVETKGSKFELLPGTRYLTLIVRVKQTFQHGGGTSSHWVEVPCVAGFVAEAGVHYEVEGLATEIASGAMSKSFSFDVAVTKRGEEENLAEGQCRF